MTTSTLSRTTPPIQSIPDGAEPNQWVAEHAAELTASWAADGAVLVRGAGVTEPADVRRLAEHLGVAVVADREPFAERADLGAAVYSSVTWPPDQPMCMHHETSYAAQVPSKMLIGCLVPPVEGGATGVADGYRVLSELPADLLAPFAARGWSLERNYSELVGTAWQEAFGTTERAVVEKYCQDNGIRTDWRSDGSLRTRQRRPAIVRHPETGRPCWFNQVAFFNQWTLEEDVREYLLFEFGADALPFNSYYGDGSPIEREVVDTINEVYVAATVREPWQAGDLLLVDNVRMAHNREPFSGRRSMAMVFGDPTTVSGATL